MGWLCSAHSVDLGTPKSTNKIVWRSTAAGLVKTFSRPKSCFWQEWESRANVLLLFLFPDFYYFWKMDRSFSKACQLIRKTETALIRSKTRRRTKEKWRSHWQFRIVTKKLLASLIFFHPSTQSMGVSPHTSLSEAPFESGFPEKELPQSFWITSFSGSRAGWQHKYYPVEVLSP